MADTLAVLPEKVFRLCALAVVCAVCVLAHTATAEPVALTGKLTNRFSDNVALEPANEISDIETRADLTLRHQTDPGKCGATTAASLGYGRWYDETYEPENYASLDFDGACRLNRGLSWELSDYLRDVAKNTRLSDTPENRTRKNVFTTGPVYAVRLGKVDRLIISAKYGRTDYSDSGTTDSERYFGSATWNHIFSTVSSGGLQLSINRTDLDTGATINTDALSLLFQKLWPSTRISGSIGGSQIESRLGGAVRKSDGLVGSLLLERDINTVTQIYFQASRDLTDQTSDFDIKYEDVVFNVSQSSAIELTTFETGFLKQLSNTSRLSLKIFANQVNRIDSAEDEDRVGGAIDYNRAISELISFRGGGDYQHRSFASDGSSDRSYRLRLGLDYKLSRDLRLEGNIGHSVRKSDLDTSEYQENWVSLGINYTFF